MLDSSEDSMEVSPQSIEMEFLDINLTKDSRLLLHAIHRAFHWWILQKTVFYSGFSNHYKKISETRKLEYFHG